MQSLLVRVLALLALGACACAHSHGHEPATQRSSAGGPLRVVPAHGERFAEQAHLLLVDGEGSEPRLGQLIGVVREQLTRAERRFAAGHPDAGVRALTGAFLMVRPGELHPMMLEERGQPLLQAAHEVARLGDEGRALALYEMLLVALPESERSDVEEHREALRRWLKPSPTVGPLSVLGEDYRVTARRATLEPTAENVARARARTTAWIEQAMQLDSRDALRPADREEFVEAYRAMSSGGAALSALFLRHGDAQGALAAADASESVRVPPGLRTRLARAANGDANAWLDLYRLYATAADVERPELAIDAEVAKAAAWGSAVALYRLAPTTVEGVQPLAGELIEYGMAEVMPLVIAPAVQESPSAANVSGALALVLRAMLMEDEVGQLADARRTFDNAQPIIELGRGFGERIRPSIGRLHYVMGSLEMRGAETARALPLMRTALAAAPSVEAAMALGTLERQQGNLDRSLSALETAMALARKAGNLTAEAEALVAGYEIRRDAGRASEGGQTLNAALTRVLEARDLVSSDAERARVERLLARVLEHFGRGDAARRATQRAYEASQSDARQLSASVLDGARRAFTLGDVDLARESGRQALEADLPPSDAVYVALWLRLLERTLRASSDGTAQALFARLNGTEAWTEALRAWGQGQLSDEGLLRAARNPVQRVEARFYAAMARRASEGTASVSEELRQIAESPAVDLMEITIARDLLAATRQPEPLPLPRDVKLP